ncbi:MAG TPA: MFS transporter, partial [Chloroflexia bacterium]|nr:MFS transporter [Chloroflexia bacterium]
FTRGNVLLGMLAALTRVTLFQSLRGRPFALVWSGQTLSRIGDHLYEVALAWWVLQKTGSAAAMGTVLICAFTPMLLFLLLGGVAVDRWPRVRVMFLSDLGRGVLAALVAGLAWTGGLEIGHIYLLSVTFGFVDAFFQPAYSAAVPELTPAAVLTSANALTSISTQTGRIIGPALAAGTMALGGAPLAFGLNALSFFLAAALLVPLLGWPAPVRAEESARANLLGDLREAARTVRTTPMLWITIIVYALVNITLAGPYSIGLPFLVKNQLHADVETLGFLYTMFPIGYVLGGLWLGRQARIRRRGGLIMGAGVVAGLMLALFGVSLPVLILAGAAVINGAALEMGNLAWTGTLQALVPGEQLGRVASMDMLGSFALLPVGYALTAAATDAWGAGPVFLTGGLLAAGLSAGALLVPAVRQFD